MQWLLPPILWLFCVLAMITGMIVLPQAQILPPPINWIGTILLAGLLFSIAGSRRFQVEKTNIKTFDKPDKLVTTGLFSWSRNPMYLGFCLSLLGVALMVNHWSAVAVASVFFLACQFWYIPFEEAAAKEKFGSEYNDYCSQVRCWF